MFLVFGQFLNQTTQAWQWQQIGGTPTNEDDANQYAYGFARNYGMVCKVVSRDGVKMYLPPIVDESALVFPDIHPEMIQTT